MEATYRRWCCTDEEGMRQYVIIGFHRINENQEFSSFVCENGRIYESLEKVEARVIELNSKCSCSSLIKYSYQEI